MDHKLGGSPIIGVIWFGMPETTAGKNRDEVIMDHLG